MVYHPPEAWGDPAGWATESLLFYGVDGRWRSLGLDDLGLPVDTGMGYDTYGAGALSPNGRWWAGRMHNGAILIDLANGRHRTINVGGGRPSEIRWDADSAGFLISNGHEGGTRHVGVPTLVVDAAPYWLWQVGLEPSGRVLSLRRDQVGIADLVEHRGGRVVELGSLRFPELGRGLAKMWGVSATTGRFAVGHQPIRLNYRRVEILIVDTDELTVEHVLRFDNRKYVVRGWSWLNRSTLLLDTSVGVLAWRPDVERLYRVFDVPPAGPGRYWTAHVASTANDGHTTTPDAVVRTR